MVGAGNPAVAELQLRAGTQAVEFISDLHLSAALPRTTAAFEHYLASTRADAVFILGDLFELCVGDDGLGDAFEQRCLLALHGAARRLPLYFMVGNRDFLAGPGFAEASGCTLLDDPTRVQAFGQHALLTHGDALCLADLDYQRFRRMVRGPAWQQAFLAKPLPERRALAAAIRHASEERKQRSAQDDSTAWADWADVSDAAALQWLRAAGAAHMVHGHTHRPGRHELAPGVFRHVLSDWDVDAAPPRAQVLRWTRAGFARIDATVAA